MIDTDGHFVFQGYGTFNNNPDEKRPWDDQPPPPQPEQAEEKHWYDLDDDQKKKLEIGGGIAAGLALLGGGYAAYKHHEKSEEDKKAAAFGAQKWLQDAQARTEQFHRNGPQGPTTWVLVHGKNFPSDMIQGGREENGSPLFIARAYYEGSIRTSISFMHRETKVAHL